MKLDRCIAILVVQLIDPRPFYKLAQLFRQRNSSRGMKISEINLCFFHTRSSNFLSPGKPACPAFYPAQLFRQSEKLLKTPKGHIPKGNSVSCALSDADNHILLHTVKKHNEEICRSKQRKTGPDKHRAGQTFLNIYFPGNSQSVLADMDAQNRSNFPQENLRNTKTPLEL